MRNLFKKTAPAPAPGIGTAPVTPGPGVPAGLVSLTKTVRISLEKKRLEGQRAAVYLVIDRSYSMAGYFRNGAVQYLADQALALAVNLDDDGIVPLVFFDSRPYPIADINLDNYTGTVVRQHVDYGGENTMGGTRYEHAIRVVTEHYRLYQANGGTDPAIVIFQTDGQPQDPDHARTALTEAAGLPIFWSFVSFGPKPVPYLRDLDSMTGRRVDNASYWHAGPDPQRTASADTRYDQDLYDNLLAEFPQWLAAARSQGILR